MIRAGIPTLPLLAFLLPAFAQEVQLSRAGLVYSVEGEVRLDDRPVNRAPGRYTFVPESSVLRAELGKAVVLLTNGAVLHIAPNSSMRLVDNRLSQPHVELPAGTFKLECSNPVRQREVSLSFLDALVLIQTEGEYHFEASRRMITVIEGEAHIRFAGQSVVVRSGQTLALRDRSQVESVRPVRVEF